MEPEWLCQVGPLVLSSKCYGKQSTMTSHCFRQKRKIRPCFTHKLHFLKTTGEFTLQGRPLMEFGLSQPQPLPRRCDMPAPTSRALTGPHPNAITALGARCMAALGTLKNKTQLRNFTTFMAKMGHSYKIFLLNESILICQVKFCSLKLIANSAELTSVQNLTVSLNNDQVSRWGRAGWAELWLLQGWWPLFPKTLKVGASWKSDSLFYILAQSWGKHPHNLTQWSFFFSFVITKVCWWCFTVKQFHYHWEPHLENIHKERVSFS